MLVTLLVLALATPAPGDGHYLIVHPPALADAARAWADHRERDGWTTHRFELGPETDRATIRAQIRAHHAAHAADDPDALQVLLLGDAATGDPMTNLPTFTFENRDPDLIGRNCETYTSDHPYAVIVPDGGGRPALIAIGRAPARDNAAALALLEKIKRYEASEPGVWRRRINYVTSEGGFGVADDILETMFIAMVEQDVPAAFDIDVIYANATSRYCPPPDEAVTRTINAMGDAFLFNYVGHGSFTAFDRGPLTGRRLASVRDLETLPVREGRNAIALLTCCSSGAYALGDEVSLAEAMLFAPDGPVGVVGGSCITHPYPNAVFQRDFTVAALDDGHETLGAAYRAATASLTRIDPEDAAIDAVAWPIAMAGGWKTTLRDHRREHARLYNLLGDPALRLQRPRRDEVTLTLDGAVVRGVCTHIRSGRAVVTFETDRRSCVDEAGLRAMPELIYDLPAQKVHGREAWIEAARHNAARVNERVLARTTVEVKDGRFEVATPAGTPSNRIGVIKAYVTGDGREAIAGTRIRRGANH